MAVIDPKVWVLANFKETQLTRVRPGQPVAVEPDMYPGVKLLAHVDSIQRGSGSRFSLLPPENATGNYVKVVQRVPVKIVFDDLGRSNSTRWGRGCRSCRRSTSAPRRHHGQLAARAKATLADKPPVAPRPPVAPQRRRRRGRRDMAKFLPPPSLRPTSGAQRQPLAYRRRGHAGHVSGSARLVGGQRGPAAHRRQPVGQLRRSDLGAHQLPGVQRHRAADDRLAEQFLRPQAVPDRLHRALHARLPRPAERPPRWASWSSPALCKGPRAGPCSPCRRRF